MNKLLFRAWTLNQRKHMEKHLISSTHYQIINYQSIFSYSVSFISPTNSWSQQWYVELSFGINCHLLMAIIKNKNERLWPCISTEKASEIILMSVSMPACWMQSRAADHGGNNKFCPAINNWGYLYWCWRDMCMSHHISTAVLPHACLTPLPLAWGSSPSSHAGTRD